MRVRMITERERTVAWLREMARTAHIGSCGCYQRGQAFRQAAEAIERGEHVGIDTASDGVTMNWWREYKTFVADVADATGIKFIPHERATDADVVLSAVKALRVARTAAEKVGESPSGSRGLTDAELVALGNLVLATALGRKSRDEERLRFGIEVTYGDVDWPDAERLTAELRRRGVLP